LIFEQDCFHQRLPDTTTFQLLVCDVDDMKTVQLQKCATYVPDQI